MPLAVANSVGELIACLRVERLRSAKGKRAWRPPTPTFKHPAIQSDRGVFLCTREPVSAVDADKLLRRLRMSEVGDQMSVALRWHR